MSELIKTKTLIDVARYSNQVIRVSLFMREAQVPFLLDKMNYLDSESDPYEIMKAVNDDINSTVANLKKIVGMMSSIDENGVALELNNEEKNFLKLFPGAYDLNSGTLTIFGAKISEYTQDWNEIKSQVYASAFENIAGTFPYSEFKNHLSALKSMSDNGRPKSDSSFDTALIYANKLSSIPKWMPFYQASFDIVGKMNEVRQSLKPKENQLIDKKFFSGRSMIYSVAQKSTYIDGNAGLEQVNSKHAANRPVLDKIIKLISELDCVRAMEIDQDVSLEKVHDILIDIKRMNIDFDGAFELKFRKLGNYRFCGVHAQKDDAGEMVITEESGYTNQDLNIIVLDLTAPGSLAHEITHFRDREDTPERSQIIEHFKPRMDKDKIKSLSSQTKSNYYFSDKEILARLGEIGYMLNAHDYQENESLDAFSQRVRAAEKSGSSDPEKLMYSIALTKNVDTYIGESSVLNEEIYFNFADWSPAEMSIVKDYTRDFFHSPSQEVTRRLKSRLDSGELAYQTKMHQKTRAPKEITRRKLSENDITRKAWGKINVSELSGTYLAGVEDGLFADGEFMEHLSIHTGDVGVPFSGPKITLDGWIEQAKAVMGLSEVVDVESRPGDALIFEMLAWKYLEKTKGAAPTDLPAKIQFLYSAPPVLADSAISQFESMGVEPPFLANDISFSKNFARSYALKKPSIELTVIHNVARQAATAFSSKVTDFGPVGVSQYGDATLQTKWYAAILKAREIFSTKGLSNDILKLQNDCFHEQATRSFDEINKDVKSHFSTFEKSGFRHLVLDRAIRADFSSLELDFTTLLLNTGFLEKYSVNEDGVEALYQKVSSYNPAKWHNGFSWEPPVIDSNDVTEKLKFILDSLAAHPSKVNPKKLGGRYDYMVTFSPHDEVEETYRQTALSPMSALLFAVKQSNVGEWNSRSGPLLDSLTKSMVEYSEKDVIANVVDVAMGKFESDQSTKNLPYRFSPHVAIASELLLSNKCAQLKKEAVSTVIQSWINSGASGEGDMLSWIKNKYSRTPDKGVYQMLSTGESLRVVQDEGIKRIVRNLSINSASINDDVKMMRPQEHFQYNSTIKEMERLNDKHGDFMSDLKGLSPVISAAFFVSTRNFISATPDKIAFASDSLKGIVGDLNSIATAFSIDPINHVDYLNEVKIQATTLKVKHTTQNGIESPVQNKVEHITKQDLNKEVESSSEIQPPKEDVKLLRPENQLKLF
jgi:hypothetical protein